MTAPTVPDLAAVEAWLCENWLALLLSFVTAVCLTPIILGAAHAIVEVLDDRRP